jgi:hypothetical protein
MIHVVFNDKNRGKDIWIKGHIFRTCKLIIEWLVQYFLCIEIKEMLVLKVMTFNIYHGKGTDKKVDLERIAEVIKKTVQILSP